ncbi:MAG: magnesium transporter [Erysipelotrichaceae bacterium]|nr:magnesium transporter [Erysipelotrichaceae bacterium]
MKRKITNEELKHLLLRGDEAEIKEVIFDIHPVVILDLIHEDEEAAPQLLAHLSDEVIAGIVEEADDDEKYELLKQFSDVKQSHILEEMSLDEVTDLLGELEDEEQKAILAKLNREDREDVKELLTYGEDTAGGLMTTEFISIRAKNTVRQTLEYLQKSTDAETTYYLYVTDRSQVLKGVVSLRDIVSSPFDTNMLEITNPNVISVRYDEDQEQVAKTFEKYGFVMMPVVDEENHMLGVITVDDIMDVMQEEMTEDIHRLGQVGKEERIDSKLGESLKSRLPWLVTNLFTAVLAAMVISYFEGTISQVVSLATIMPIVTGMGGNAGTQSLTIVVRGLSLGELSKENALRILRKEIGVGMLSGLVIGILIASGAMLFEGNPVFGLVTGIAMFLNMMLANIAGYFIPVVLEKCHVDPALASGVFVTTVTDVLGFLFFLGLATMALPYLL